MTEPGEKMTKDVKFTYEQVELLAKIAKHLAIANHLRPALEVILDWLSQFCAMRRGVISIINETGAEVQANLTVGEIPSSQTGKMRYKAGEGITGEVFATGKPVYVAQMNRMNKFLDRSGLRQHLDQSRLSFFCVPITYRGKTIGTLSVDQDSATVETPKQELNFLLEVTQLLAPFVQRLALEERLEIFRHAKHPGGAFGKMVGKSNAIREIQNLIARVANARTTVLITGETGTGKGVAAELIHQLGPSREQPFVEVNCGAIPENLIESELFGHEKGAFTGAMDRRIGVLERAGSGTVFLDEIGELPLTAQTRLLRVLQNREFERVGGSKTIRTGCRILAATNRDLETAIMEGTFRSDLFYRLNVFPIQVPPLRERGKADIMLLVDFFIQRFADELKKNVVRIDTPAIDMLTAYHWPGNIREVENVIERAVLLTDGDTIHGHHLPPSLQMNRYSTSQQNHGSFEILVRNFEIELITEALKDSSGNQTLAAKNLGITKRMIQYKIQNYKID